MTEAQQLWALLTKVNNPGWHALDRIGEDLEEWIVVDVIRGDDRRWGHVDTFVVKSALSGNYYRFWVDVAATEYQDTELVDELPQQVARTVRTIEVQEWTKL